MYDVIGLKQQRFRIGLWSGPAVLLFIERVGQYCVAVPAPAITGVAHNSEEPRTPISTDKCSEVSKGPQGRLLHRIFRIVFIPHQPARQPIGRIEMWKDDRVKALPNSKHHRRSIRSITHGAL